MKIIFINWMKYENWYIQVMLLWLKMIKNNIRNNEI